MMMNSAPNISWKTNGSASTMRDGSSTSAKAGDVSKIVPRTIERITRKTRIFANRASR
jgi:hypothetical protein